MPYTTQSRYHNVTEAFTARSWTNGIQTTNIQSQTTSSARREYSTKDWVKTPNFWALRRSGALLPENNYTFTVEYYPGGSFTFEGQQQVGNTLHYRKMVRSCHSLSDYLPLGTYPWYSYRNPPSEVELYSRLAGRARRSQFSLPVTLIEARRTAQMIAETATTLARTISNLRRGDLLGAARQLGLNPTTSQVRRFNRRYGRDPRTTAANYWLQYQYGWKPLLNDAKNAAEALAEMALQSERMTTSVRATFRENRNLQFPNHVCEVSPQYICDVNYVGKFTRRAVWRFKPTAADIPGLFGLVNPFEVIWEVIPFSFVADWFLPIGNYLSALDLPLRFQHVGGSKGYRGEELFYFTAKSGVYTIVVPATSAGPALTKYVYVSRTKMSGPPIPNPLQFTMQANLGATRVTSAIALLWQQASRLRR